jgi:hypothetical protein
MDNLRAFHVAMGAGIASTLSTNRQANQMPVSARMGSMMGSHHLRRSVDILARCLGLILLGLVALAVFNKGMRSLLTLLKLKHS